jgi:hypothetical protein
MSSTQSEYRSPENRLQYRMIVYIARRKHHDFGVRTLVPDVRSLCLIGEQTISTCVFETKDARQTVDIPQILHNFEFSNSFCFYSAAIIVA